MSRKFLDLSVSLQEGIKSDPDFMLPKINYHYHKETAEEMISFFPGLKKTDLPGEEGWAMETITVSTHNGTHMDAPWHFDCGEKFIDQTPLETCLGTADLVRLPNTRPRELLTVSHLGPLADTFQAGHHLLLNTNWSKRFGEELYVPELPRIGEELAHWCVDRGVKILGVEPLSVANVLDAEELTRIHRILLSGGVTIVEGLVNLALIPVERCFFAARTAYNRWRRDSGARPVDGSSR